MHGLRMAGVLIAALGLILCAACSKQPQIDWSAPEDFFISEQSTETDEGARMEFHSLVDAPADGVYTALADTEHYAQFVDGVTDTGLVSSEGNTKVIRITQTVIGQQNRAQVKWTLHPDQKKIEFQTLQTDGNYNDGEYTILASPDGKRSYVISVFHVKRKGAPQNVPLGVLKSATRESFGKAARSIKKRALATG
jgi:carbon monoxide dehydrogenase subunit G